MFFELGNVFTSLIYWVLSGTKKCWGWPLHWNIELSMPHIGKIIIIAIIIIITFINFKCIKYKLM